MIKIDSKKLPSKKNSIQSTVHSSLQIRTNKHRCFVFCIGHTSLTCVPGIGKKNKHLLNQSGIHDLSTLYSKYRSINNIQHFKQWLQHDIGFTSYQAKMTTCGIGTKLGEIKETNTGLIPIYCPSKERREENYQLLFNDRNIKKRNRSNPSENERNEEERIRKQKIENIKLENLSPSSNQDERGKYIPINDESLTSSDINNWAKKPKNGQTSDSFDKKLKNKLSDNYLTGVKSPDNPIFAIRPPSMNDNDESDSSSTPTKPSFDRNYGTNELSKTKPAEFQSFPMFDQMTHDHNIHEILPTSKSSSHISPRNGSKILKSGSNSDQQKKNQIQSKGSSIIRDSTLPPVNSIPSSELFMENKTKSEGSLPSANVILQHSSSPQETIMNYQPISFSQLSTLATDDSQNDADQKKVLDKIGKETHQSSSLPASRTDAIDNQTEQGSSSERKKSVSHSSLDDSSVDKSPINKRASIKSNPTTDKKLNEIFTLTKQKLQPTLNALQDKKDELLSASKKSPDSSISNEHPKSILRSTHSKPASPIDTDLLFGAIKEQQRQTQNKSFTTMSSPELDRNKPAVNDDISLDIKSKLEEESLNEADNKSISSIKRSYASLPVSTPAVFPIRSKTMKKSDILNSPKSTPETYLTPESDKQTPLDPTLDIRNITSLVNHSSTSPPTEEANLKQHDNTNTQKNNDTPSLILESKGQEYIPNQYDSSYNKPQQGTFQKEIGKAVSQIMKQAAQIVHADTQSAHVNSMSATKMNSIVPSSIQTSVFEPPAQSKARERVPALESKQLKHLSTKTSSTDQRTQFKNNKTSVNHTSNEKLKPTQSDSSGISENKLLPLKKPSNDYESEVEKQSEKPLTTTDKQTNYDSLQQEESTSNAKSSTSTNVSPLMKASEYNRGPNFDSSSVLASHKNDPLTNLVLSEINQQISLINKSSELLKTKPSNDKKSLSTLSSLSDSSQSINRVNSSIDKTRSNSTSNINPLTTNYLKNDEPYNSITPSNHINQLINKNLSETISSKESFELKEKIFDNHKLRIISNTIDPKYLSISSPSCPIPCNAFWDNISNEKNLSQRKNHHFKLIRKKSI